MRETALLEYRANPTDENFNAVAREYAPWLRRTGFETMRGFYGISPSVDLDDLTNEGLLSISRSARRFLHFCPTCGETFLDRADLRAHAAAEHRVLGRVELVGIDLFVQTSAKLAMRRAVRRSLRPEEVLVNELPEVADADQEGRLILADLLRTAEARLSGESLALLIRLINGEALESAAVDDFLLDVAPEFLTRKAWPRRPRNEWSYMPPTNEEKEDTMEATTETVPERGPRWKILSLQTLKNAAKEVLGYEVGARTVRGAYEEVLAHLEGRTLEYVCGRCGAPIDDKMPNCWACAGAISDEEDPEMKESEVKSRAKSLGIQVSGKTAKELKREIEAAEAKRRSSARSTDVRGMEAQKINEALTEAMPDGWSKRVVKQFTTYWDGTHKRIGVLCHGLRINFSVEDGLFGEDLPEGLEFLSAEERKRRHFGRDNYVYRGDVAKVALSLCAKVFKRYGKTAKPAKAKK